MKKVRFQVEDTQGIGAFTAASYAMAAPGEDDITAVARSIERSLPSTLRVLNTVCFADRRYRLTLAAQGRSGFLRPVGELVISLPPESKRPKSVGEEVKAIIRALSDPPPKHYQPGRRMVQARVLREDTEKVVIGRCVDSEDGTETVVDLYVTVHKPKG
jgi:hypothetical protein